MTAADRLDAIEARANAATEGPWEYVAPDDADVTTRIQVASGAWSRCPYYCRWPEGDPDCRGTQGEAWAHEHRNAEHVASGAWRNDDKADLDVSDADAAFIAAARTDVPALVAALRAVLAPHLKRGVYELADECGHDPDEYGHDDDHRENADGYVLCYVTRLADVCETCSDQDGDNETAYPCPTVVAITAALDAS
jgi:hypothetical protein